MRRYLALVSGVAVIAGIAASGGIARAQEPTPQEDIATVIPAIFPPADIVTIIPADIGSIISENN